MNQFEWAKQVCDDAGCPGTTNNQQNITRWMAAEQPPTHWWNGRHFNPLDVSDFVNDSFSFATLDASATATAKVIVQPNMKAIHDALQADAAPAEFSTAVVKSPWAASHYGVADAGAPPQYVVHGRGLDYLATIPVSQPYEAPNSAPEGPPPA